MIRSGILLLSIVASMRILAAPAFMHQPQQIHAQSAGFNFAAVGDWGCKAATDATVSNIISKRPERTLSLGDNSYVDSPACWFDAVDPIDSRMKIAIGNHDVADLDEYLDHFDLSRAHYSFKYNNVRVIVINTEESYCVGSSQYNFVKSRLSSAASDSDIDWIIVMTHRTMYNSPTAAAPSSSLRNAYHPLFDQYGVDLVLHGHNHNFERIYPIKYNPSSSSNPTVTSTSRGTYNDPEGQIYAIVGTGGQSIHELDGKRRYIEDQYEGYGFLDIRIIDDGNTMIARFYSNDGATQDSFTIKK